MSRSNSASSAQLHLQPLPQGDSPQQWRFIRKGDSQRTQALFFIDGACSNNGNDATAAPRAGAAAIVGPKAAGYNPLKRALPRDSARHTSNRAELEAALLVLGLRFWRGEGFNNVVLATDSEYLVLGICERIHKWVQRGWRNANGGDVANRDLWKRLLDKIKDMESRGCHVQFWLIPRALNEADAYAKEAAEIPDGERPSRRMEYVMLPAIHI